MNDQKIDELLKQLQNEAIPEKEFSSPAEFKRKFFERAQEKKPAHRIGFWLKMAASFLICSCALIAAVAYIYGSTVRNTFVGQVCLTAASSQTAVGSAVRCATTAHKSIQIHDILSHDNYAASSQTFSPASHNIQPAYSRPVFRYAHSPMVKFKQPSFNTEEYKHVGEQPFYETATRPLSTFGADVDTAGYTNLRRILLNGSRHYSKGAVRVEEFLNYFRYNYRKPAGDEKFQVNFEMMDTPWAPQHKLLLVGVQAKDFKEGQLPPSNYVFLVDNSGSMSEYMELVREAMSMLANNLRSQDRVSIVTYGGGVQVLADGISGKKKAQIVSILRGLNADGYTPGGAGIQTAYKLAHANFIKGGNNRIVLITDGDFNVGVSSESDLVEMVKKERQSAIYLTAVGVGSGNYKDNKMKMIANCGNGNYIYFDSMREAKKVMLKEFAGKMFTVAKDVKFQIEFNPGTVKMYRQLGYELRKMAARDFNDDTKDAGEVGAGQQVTVLYELVMAGSSEESGVDALKYQKSQSTGSSDLLTFKLRYQEPEGGKPSVKREYVVKPQIEATDNIRWAACVAEFAQILRDSQYKGKADISTLRQRAQLYLGNDQDGSKAEFLMMIRNTAERVEQETQSHTGRSTAW